MLSVSATRWTFSRISALGARRSRSAKDMFFAMFMCG